MKKQSQKTTNLDHPSIQYTLDDIAGQIGGTVEGDGNILIFGVAKIEDAGQGQMTFLANTKYQKYLDQSNASVIIVPNDVESVSGKIFLRAENPYFAFMKAVRLFHPEQPYIEKGIHPTAVIGNDAKLGENISIGAYAVIGDRCSIGSNTTILPHVVLGNDVSVGEDCILHAHVSLRERVQIGNRVVIYDGTVVGSDGFGFAPEGGKYHKIPQIGTVVIEDDVEIGANVTIDRATLGETRICQGVKLDNLIQIAHNCEIGESTVVAAQTGISGSTKIGKHVRVGGQAGFAGHMSIGDGAAIGAQSGVTKSVAEGVYVFGYPAKPHKEEFRIQGAQRRLPELLKEIKELKKRVQQLEQE